MTSATITKLPTIRSILARGHVRLVVMAVILASATLTISGALLLRSYADMNLQLAARTLRYAVEPAVYFGDRDALNDAVTSLVGSGELSEVEVLGADGAPLMQWRAPGDDAGVGAFARSLLTMPPVELPIFAGSGEQLGKVRVTASPTRLVGFAMSCLIICACSIGLTLLATRILTRRLDEEVVAPIENLARVAETVRQERDFRLRAEPSQIAEINLLSSDFNALLVELEGWHDGFMAENRNLAHLAEHDLLTGLGNRLQFERELQLAITLADSGNREFTLLFIDINGFKQVNDRFGHQAGDAMLAEFSLRLVTTMRARDQAFRLGGDEFVVIVDPVVNSPNGQAIVDRILEAAKAPVQFGEGQSLPMSISIGISTYPRDATSAEALIQHADARMYANKKEHKLHGKNG